MADLSRLNISGTAICSACCDKFPIEQLVRPGCGDNYCETCFVSFFDYQASSLPNFPPDCCGIILHPHDYLSILPDIIIQDWFKIAKLKRETTRTACATPSCDGPNIDPIAIHNDWGLCERCYQLTCTRCGQLQAAHSQLIGDQTTATDVGGNNAQNITNTTTTTTVTTSPDDATPISLHQPLTTPRTCPPRLIDHTFEDAALSYGWKRCPACDVPIERTDGCPEMVCMCGEIFCYDCGKARGPEREHGCMCQEY